MQTRNHASSHSWFSKVSCLFTNLVRVTQADELLAETD